MHWEGKNCKCVLKYKCEYIKYGISLILRVSYSVEYNDFTYLAVHNYGGIIWGNNVTSDLQYTNIKIIMTLKIITN